PSWLTLLKHPVSLVHGARPYCERYIARSASAFGSSKASTMPTTWPPPAVDDGRLYALCRSVGPYPEGVSCGETCCAFMPVRINVKHRARVGFLTAAQPGTVGTALPAPTLDGLGEGRAVAGAATPTTATAIPMTAATSARRYRALAGTRPRSGDMS